MTEVTSLKSQSWEVAEFEFAPIPSDNPDPLLLPVHMTLVSLLCQTQDWADREILMGKAINLD